MKNSQVFLTDTEKIHFTCFKSNFEDGRAERYYFNFLNVLLNTSHSTGLLLPMCREEGAKSREVKFQKHFINFIVRQTSCGLHQGHF